MTLRPINNKQKREKFASLFLDEIKLALLATITRMWVKIGTQAEIITDDNHEKCYGYTAMTRFPAKPIIEWPKILMDASFFYLLNN